MVLARELVIGWEQITMGRTLRLQSTCHKNAAASIGATGSGVVALMIGKAMMDMLIGASSQSVLAHVPGIRCEMGTSLRLL
jgi:hypothetical protein